MNQKPVKAPQSAVIIACLILANFAVFARVATFDFVNYDDPVYVLDNPHVQAGLKLKSVKAAFTESFVSGWYPLTMLSYMLNAQLFGLNAGTHHLTSLILHIANTILVFLVLHRMTGAQWRSAAVAALFAIHPQHVEAVAWIAGRKDVLSTLFWWLTIWAYAYYIERRGPRRYLLVLACFATGFLAKGMLVTLPFVLLLLDYWPLHRVRGDQAARKAGLNVWMKLVVEKIPLFVVTGAFSILLFLTQETAGTVASLEQLSLTERLANSTIAYATYMGRMVWPPSPP